MTDAARTLVQTVGTLEIRPSRNSVDRLGIWTAVTLIQRVPSCRMRSRARYLPPWTPFVNCPAGHPKCKSRPPDAKSVFSAETRPLLIRDRRGSTRSRQGRKGTAARGSEYAIRHRRGLL